MTNKSSSSWHLFGSKKKKHRSGNNRSHRSRSKSTRNRKTSRYESESGITWHPEKRMVLLGTSSVGKTCLAFKYVHSRLLGDSYLLSNNREIEANTSMDQGGNDASVSSSIAAGADDSRSTHLQADTVSVTSTPTASNDNVSFNDQISANTVISPMTPQNYSAANSGFYNTAKFAPERRDAAISKNISKHYEQVTPQQLIRYLKDYLIMHGEEEAATRATVEDMDSSHGSTNKKESSSSSSENLSAPQKEPENAANLPASPSTNQDSKDAGPPLKIQTSSNQDATKHKKENSLQYSRLVWFYQQLLHEYHEFQRFQMLQEEKQNAKKSMESTEAENSEGSSTQDDTHSSTYSDMITKHEQKLKREAKLLQQRLKDQSNFNQHLSTDLKRFKKKLITLQDKWMKERNEKIELEMERDNEGKEIRELERAFKKVAALLQQKDPDEVVPPEDQKDSVMDSLRKHSTSSTQNHHPSISIVGPKKRVDSYVSSELSAGVGSSADTTDVTTSSPTAEYEHPHQYQYIASGGIGNTSFNTAVESPITPRSAFVSNTSSQPHTADVQSTHSSQSTSMTDSGTLPSSHPNYDDSSDDEGSSTSSESIFSLNRQPSHTNLPKDHKHERLFCPPTKQLMSCIQIFNKQSTKAAIHSLIRCGFVKDDPRSIAVFLVRCASLNPKRLGEYLADEKNLNILHHYAHYQMERLLSDFPFDIALKAFIQSLQLPKEGQQVTRITEAFSDAYVETNQQHELDRQLKRVHSEVKDPDNAFLLACSILMLNVDLHSGKTNRPPMSRDQFVALFNDDEIPHSYLKSLYDDIKANEWKDMSATGNDAEDLYPPEVEQESSILPMVKSVDGLPGAAADDHQLKSSVSLSELMDQSSGLPSVSRERSLTRCSTTSPASQYNYRRASRLRTRSVHQRQKSKSFDMHIHTRQDIPLYFSLREFTKHSIYTFQIRDTASIEWSPEAREQGPEAWTHSRRSTNPLIFPESTEKQLHKGDFFLCLYNTRNRSSFLAIEHIVDYISKVRSKEARSVILDQIMIVAIDFSDDSRSRSNSNRASMSHRKEITVEEGQRLALEIGVPFMSVRILKDQEVRDTFRTAMKYCLRPVSRHMSSMYRQLGLGAGNVVGGVDEWDGELSTPHPVTGRQTSPDEQCLSFDVQKETHEFSEHVVDTIFYVK